MDTTEAEEYPDQKSAPLGSTKEAITISDPVPMDSSLRDDTLRQIIPSSSSVGQKDETEKEQQSTDPCLAKHDPSESPNPDEEATTAAKVDPDPDPSSQTYPQTVESTSKADSKADSTQTDDASLSHDLKKLKIAEGSNEQQGWLSRASKIHVSSLHNDLKEVVWTFQRKELSSTKLENRSGHATGVSDFSSSVVLKTSELLEPVPKYAKLL